MEYIYLQGSEQVSNAGYNISRAAEQMKQAASDFNSAVFQFQRFMDDWLQRFEVALEKKS